MAKITTDQVKAALTEAGVTFLARAKIADLQALLPEGHALKGDAPAGKVEAGTEVDKGAENAPLKTHFEEPSANLPYVPAAKVPAGAKGIVFHLNEKVIKTRGFSADEHGKDWQDVAEEFHKTNEKKVLKREIL